MSRVILLLLLLSCFGCGHSGTGYDPIMEPGMRFELFEDKGWEIIVEGRETWRKYYKGGNLPLQQYFPSKYTGSDPFSKFNFFYAVYQLDESNELALLVNFPYSFTRANSTKSIKCVAISSQIISIATNRVDVSFDNSSAYLLINQRKITGPEIRYDKMSRFENLMPYGHNIYDLASNEVTVNRQRELNPRKPVPYPTFNFWLLVSCRDLENAVFVIDGFTTRDGKRLPPLKVRLNYYDFDMVPEFPRELVSMCK